jgi:hypothetical protein
VDEADDDDEEDDEDEAGWSPVMRLMLTAFISRATSIISSSLSSSPSSAADVDDYAEARSARHARHAGVRRNSVDWLRCGLAETYDFLNERAQR